MPILAIQLGNVTFKFLQLERNAQCPPGYVLLSVDNPSKNIIPQMKLYNVLPSFMKLLKQQNGNEKYFVDPGKIRSWIQKILDKTLPSIKNEFPQFGILDVCFSYLLIYYYFLN